MSDPYSHQTYLLRRKVLTLLSPKFHVYDSDGELVLFAKQKAFKLKEDIRLYTDESMDEERLTILARQAIDFSAAYDVVDANTREKVGALRRKGFKSMLRDSWEFLDADDRQIATLQEDSMALALVRRFLANIIPQKFHLRDVRGYELAEYRQYFNPFVLKYDITIVDSEAIDPRLVLAGGVLLAAIEGRQKS